MKDQPELLMHSCAGCGTSWFGLVRVHFSVCHVTLDSVDIWDTHRVEDERQASDVGAGQEQGRRVGRACSGRAATRIL